MTLDSPDSSTGSAAWFMQLWNQLSRDDRQDFQSKIAQMLGVGPNDFCVNIRIGSECPVIFYLLSTSRLEHIAGVEGRWNLTDKKKSSKKQYQVLKRLPDLGRITKTDQTRPDQIYKF